MDGIADRLRARGAVDEEVGVTTVPLPVTAATMPEWFANDCTKPPLMLPSTLLPNRCVHCPPTLTRLVLSVPVAIVASNGLNATVGATSSRGEMRLTQPARP